MAKKPSRRTIMREKRRAAKADACHALGAMLDDEEKGIREYTEMASLLKAAGMKGAAKKARTIARQEKNHAAAVVRMVNQACGIKPPKRKARRKTKKRR